MNESDEESNLDLWLKETSRDLYEKNSRGLIYQALEAVVQKPGSFEVDKRMYELLGERYESFDAVIHKSHLVHNAMHSGTTKQIADSCFELGRAVEKWTYLQDERYNQMAQAFIEKARKEQPLRNKVTSGEFVKELAQGIAQEVWERDAGQSLYLALACDQTWPILKELAEKLGYGKYLPKSRETLKRWLRPEAPAYATRAGRPKNKL